MRNRLLAVCCLLLAVGLAACDSDHERLMEMADGYHRPVAEIVYVHEIDGVRITIADPAALDQFRDSLKRAEVEADWLDGGMLAADNVRRFQVTYADAEPEEIVIFFDDHWLIQNLRQDAFFEFTGPSLAEFMEQLDITDPQEP